MKRKFRTVAALGVLALGGALLAALLPACAPSESGASRPGILLITVDGLVLDDVSAGGGPIAVPALDRLTAGARVWGDAWTAAPLARPAAATYLTGVAPDRHGVFDDVDDRLPDDVADLGTLLTAAGYRSAAFSESSAMMANSGLVRGWSLVDPAPTPNDVLRRHTPNLEIDGSVPAAFAAWTETVPPGERWFAWVHLAGPFRAQQHPEQEGAEAAFEAFDDGLTRILDALEARGDDATVVLAGTFGMVAGPPGEANGLGTSMAESALQVPVIVRGVDVDTWRPADEFVWAPDVAVTIAGLGGVALDDAEGIDMRERAPADRVAWAGSRVPFDQLGWEPIAAARRGSARVERAGGDRAGTVLDATAEVDGATRDRLVAVLDERAIPLGPSLELDAVRPLLEQVGVEIDPAPGRGRAVPAGPERQAILEALWENRRVNAFPLSGRGPATLEALVQAAPESALPPVDLGLYLTLFRDDPRGIEVGGRAVARHPTRPDVVRWFGLTVLNENLDVAEQLLRTVLEVRPADPFLLYDLACLRARQGDPAGALERLREAFAAGFTDVDMMISDPDLRPLRENGELSRLMREVRR